uniref:Uncharacterized protein n=1 Tax=Setaria italica TaxID=4555 RepID=K3YWJ0_SETIT
MMRRLLRLSAPSVAAPASSRLSGCGALESATASPCAASLARATHCSPVSPWPWPEISRIPHGGHGGSRAVGLVRPLRRRGARTLAPYAPRSRPGLDLLRLNKAARPFGARAGAIRRGFAAWVGVKSVGGRRAPPHFLPARR